MPNVADIYGPLIAAVFSAAPPRAASPEAAMEQVRRGSTPSNVESQYFEYFKDDWQRRTADKPLSERVHQCLGLHVSVASRWLNAEKKVGISNPQVMKAAFARVADAAEAEIVSALVADSDGGLQVWQGVVSRDRTYIEKSKEIQAFTQRVTHVLLEHFATRAAAAAAKKSGMTASSLKRLADVQVRAIVLENRELLVDAAIAGVAAWSMPVVEADDMGAVLSLGSGLTGGVGSVVTTVASLPEVFVVGTATALGFTGIGILVVGMGLGIAAYIDSVKSAEEAARQHLLEAAIKKETINAFSQLADGIMVVQDTLAMVCAADAMKEGIDLQSVARDELRRFIWQRMFPAMTTATLVAATAFVTATMNARLNPVIAGS